MYVYVYVYCWLHPVVWMCGLWPWCYGCHIRPSVDGLCRDGPSEISRDPRTKRLQTQPKRLGSPEHSRDSYVPTHRPKGPLPTLSASRENSHTRESCDPGVIIFIIIFFRPAISLLGPDETLIFSPRASMGPSGVHGHRAIAFLPPCEPRSDRGA